MAKVHGKGGIIKVADTDAVGNLQSWNLDVQGDTLEGYSMGDDWKDNEIGAKFWSGSAEAYLDPADAGQISLDVGDVIALHFYPGGDGSGDTYRSGTALINGTPISASKDGWVSITFNFVGKSALVTGTVS